MYVSVCVCMCACVCVSVSQSLRHGTDSWSLSELAHAIILLAHFHSLSTFVLGCGITLDAECCSSSESSSGHVSADESKHHHSLTVSHSVCLSVSV